MSKQKSLSISSNEDTLKKLREIECILKNKSIYPYYKGRMSDALIINSLIEILYSNKESLTAVPGNDYVKRELEYCLTRNRENKS